MKARKQCSQPIEEGELCEPCKIKKMSDRVEWWERAVEGGKKVGQVALLIVPVVIAIFKKKKEEG